MSEQNKLPRSECAECQGTGQDKHHGFDCAYCAGDGWVLVYQAAKRPPGAEWTVMTTPDNPLIDAARGRDAKQPEALRLADALDCEGHAGMSKAAKELRRQHARITELESELFAERRHSRSRNAAAVRTLAAMGYSWHGIEQWTPPKTPAP